MHRGAVQVPGRIEGEVQMKNLSSFVPLVCVLGVAACSSDRSLEDGGADGSSNTQEDAENYVTGGDGDGDGDGAVLGDGNLGYDGNLGIAAGSGGASSVIVEPPSTEVEKEPAMGGAAPVDDFSTNPFVVVEHDPLSTFAADVDTASYDLFRAYVGNNQLPPTTGVRLEEFVNYFDYDYPSPEIDGEHPFSIHLSSSPNLVNRSTQILRVGIQGATPPPEDKKPTNLVFLVDVSGSMMAEMDMVQTTLRLTLDLLDASDTIAIVTYASSPGTLLSATEVTDRETILAAIESLSAGGSTNGSGGIDAAYAEAQMAYIEGGVNHVLICTDGDFNVGNYDTDSLEQLIIEKRKTGVTLTALAFGTSGVNDAMMERVSNAGDGIYGYIGSEELAKKYVEERMLSSLVHIAKDMKIQVEFNAEHVLAYRLLGYENRAIADQDFRDDVVDAGEIGAGHRVTALYELVLKGEALPTYEGVPQLDEGAPFGGDVEVASEALVLVKVRYKEPGASESDPATEVAASLSPEAIETGFDGSGSDLQWAVAVASFAEILKGSPYADVDALDSIRLVLADQAEVDDERAEFLQLFDQARALLP
jgi:Ca-activated chloride channel family protein